MPRLHVDCCLPESFFALRAQRLVYTSKTDHESVCLLCDGVFFLNLAILLVSSSFSKIDVTGPTDGLTELGKYYVEDFFRALCVSEKAGSTVSRQLERSSTSPGTSSKEARSQL